MLPRFALLSLFALCRASQSAPGSSAFTLFLHDGGDEFSDKVTSRFPWMRVDRVTDERATLREAGGDAFLYDTLVVSDMAGTEFPIDEPFGPRYQTVEVETMASITAAQRRMTGGLSVKRILDFIDEGAGNLLLFTQSVVHERLVNELGFAFERPSAAPDGSGASVPVYVPEVAGVSGASVRLPEVGPASPRVVPQAKNVLAFPVMGDRVACIQTRNGGRACVVVGSFATFPEKIVEGLLSWISGERLWLKTANLRHVAADPTLSHKVEQGIFKMYTAEQDVRFSVEVNTRQARFVKKQAVAGDAVETKVFLEVTLMGDVKHRVRMSPTEGGSEGGWTRYETVVKMPEDKRVYTMGVKVEAGDRIGWNEAKNVEEKITVRTPRHDDFPRFLVAGMPWYAAVFTSLLGTCVFVLFMAQELSAKQDQDHGVKKKTQ